MSNRHRARQLPSIKRRMGLVAILVGLSLVGLVTLHWAVALEPELRQQAEDNIRAIAQAQGGPFERAFSADSADDIVRALERAAGRVLLLTNPNTGSPFFLGVEVLVDYSVAAAPAGALDLSLGDVTCADCIATEIPLFSETSRELLGIARFQGSRAFYDQFRGDVRNKSVLVALAILAIVSLAWWHVDRYVRTLGSLADGLRAWGEGKSQSIPDPEGPMCREVEHIRSTLDDLLAGLEERSGEIQRAKDRLQAIMDNAGVLVYLKDLEGRYILVNKTFVDELQISEEEALGLRTADLFPAENAVESERLDEYVRREKLAISVERQFLFPSGERSFVTVRFPLFDETGELYAFGGVATDVTEHRRLRETNVDLEREVESREKSEKALRESERRYRSVVEDQTELIGRFRPDGKMTFVNNAYCKYFGKKRSEIEGSTFTPFILEEDRAIVFGNVSRLNAEDPVATCEYRVILPDGTIRWQQWTHRAIIGDDGSVAEYQGVGSDITERKEAQEELREAQAELLRSERLATLGQLTATVSHELRNPLGAMLSSIYVVRKRLDSKDERLVRAIERVERGIGRCDRIIDELLDFTRSGHIEARPVTIDVWLGEVLDEQGAPDGISVERRLGLEGVELAADAEKLRRAVINLYENACQAVAAQPPNQNGDLGSVAIASRRAQDRFEISIADTGAGIPDQVLARLFEPLYSTRAFGVGLGLIIAKQIVEGHGGGIEVKTEEQRGTEAILWLPADRQVHG